MASNNFYQKINIGHLPTFLLIVGYPIFWMEIYFFRLGEGRTTYLATLIWVLISITVVWTQRSRIVFGLKKLMEMLKTCYWFEKMGLGIFGLLTIFIFLILSYAAILPIHLGQEFDALNYHYTCPRQHLIMGSFQHIRWSSADLFPLPIDFALAPYWFVTFFPNKISQFIFFLGLISVFLNLVLKKRSSNLGIIMMSLGIILGTHALGIQAGTAMLDIVLAYLFLATIDSLLNGQIGLAAIEFVFLFWSKAFVPVQLSLIIISVFIVGWLMKNAGFKILLDFENPIRFSRTDLKKFLIYMVCLSVFVGGPFMAKSINVAGTPLYPFAVGLFKANAGDEYNEEAIESISTQANNYMKTKDNYGHGRSLVNFVKHLWLIAVPEKSVNNKFDYPFGLTYLLLIGPFLFFLIRCIKQRKLSLAAVFILVYWSVWWFGSQQSRFLFIPVLLMFICVLRMFERPSRILLICILFAQFTVAFSVFRAHYHDFFVPFESVLRPEDRELIEVGKSLKAGESLVTSQFDAAYASFPVMVINNDATYVLKF